VHKPGAAIQLSSLSPSTAVAASLTAPPKLSLQIKNHNSNLHNYSQKQHMVFLLHWQTHYAIFFTN